VLQEDEDGWKDRQAALDLLLKWEGGSRAHTKDWHLRINVYPSREIVTK
jgi:hypothetical protein